MALTAQDLVARFKKHPLAIICGLLSLGLAAAIYFRSSLAAETDALLKQKEEEGRKILNNVRNAANLKEQYDALSAVTQELEARLVRATQRAENQQYFYRIESETGVRENALQQTYNPSASAAQRGPPTLYKGISYTVSVQGEYRQILDFIGHLESGRHFYRLVSGSISRLGQSGATGSALPITLTLNLELLGMP